VRVLVAGTQIDLSFHVPRGFSGTTTMSWEMRAFSGRESCNEVHTH
jgi:hypothetical protein